MTHSRFWRSTVRLTALAAAIFSAAAPAHATLDIYSDALAWQTALAHPTTLIGFDDQADLTPLASQYPGVNFNAFSGGNPLAAAYSFTQSGPNVMSLGDPPLRGAGGVAMDFTRRQQGVAFWYLDAELTGNKVEVFGGASQLLGSFELVYPNPIPIAWRFVGFIDSASDIRRLTVATAANDMVALDSLQLAPVPEPASAVLLLLGSAALLRTVRRRAMH